MESGTNSSRNSNISILFIQFGISNLIFHRELAKSSTSIMALILLLLHILLLLCFVCLHLDDDYGYYSLAGLLSARPAALISTILDCRPFIVSVRDAIRAKGGPVSGHGSVAIQYLFFCSIAYHGPGPGALTSGLFVTAPWAACVCVQVGVCSIYWWCVCSLFQFYLLITSSSVHWKPSARKL